MAEPLQLPPLSRADIPHELWRRLSLALEYEGWQEAETLYHQIHTALAGAEPALRARALMDHSAALRRLSKESEAAAKEAEAEALVGGPIVRETGPKSSVDELNEKGRAQGLWARIRKFFS